ncbi:hypothetical protein F7725_002471 [Dissostichus mawsoni]|uniref:Uncharacterized protein n=1 Tax=Dissostichus mawsoni TaxID=36200 RepID=A0A7J5Y2G4_DISMA|nr:hypothetical protein F7725_002471 [Dissostichus mawsoni]
MTRLSEYSFLLEKVSARLKKLRTGNVTTGPNMAAAGRGGTAPGFRKMIKKRGCFGPRAIAVTFHYLRTHSFVLISTLVLQIRSNDFHNVTVSNHGGSSTDWHRGPSSVYTLRCGVTVFVFISFVTSYPDFVFILIPTISACNSSAGTGRAAGLGGQEGVFADYFQSRAHGDWGVLVVVLVVVVMVVMVAGDVWTIIHPQERLSLWAVGDSQLDAAAAGLQSFDQTPQVRSAVDLIVQQVGAVRGVRGPAAGTLQTAGIERIRPIPAGLAPGPEQTARSASGAPSSPQWSPEINPAPSPGRGAGPEGPDTRGPWTAAPTGSRRRAGCTARRTPRETPPGSHGRTEFTDGSYGHVLRHDAVPVFIDLRELCCQPLAPHPPPNTSIHTPPSPSPPTPPSPSPPDH